ncbi:MAG TPA: double-strand break repair helicase AddA [Candidatus Defluviicoccus seviourii]|nr:double-strand break repair helicase AddA [Candidatus Defluviicoccus seviourii]
MSDVSAIRTPDPMEAQRGAADPTASVWVAASAGTGKTKILTDRVLNLMLAETRPERILCLTFTKAAAAEMSSRITEQLAQWAVADDDALKAALHALVGHPVEAETRVRARKLFAHVLDTPGGMKIQTIHAFCQSLLGRFPLEAGVAPHFAIVDDRDAAELMRSARDSVLRRIGDETDPLARALADLTPYLQEVGFAALSAALTRERGRIADLIERHQGVEPAIAAMRALLRCPDGTTVASVRADACRDDAFDEDGLRHCAAALAAGSPADQARGGAIALWLQASAAERDPLFEGYLRQFLTEKSLPRKTLITQAALKRAPGAQEILTREAERLRAVLIQGRTAVTAEATAAVMRLGSALLAEYQAQKRYRSLLDYDDLIHNSERLLEGGLNAAWVLYKLDGGIDHVLIDEAQDTSPDQWQVIRALTTEFFAGLGARAAGRTIFAVGDVKQSIFSFQGADPEHFIRNRAHFSDHVRAAKEIWRPIDLSVSFRSTRAVLAAVDAVFSLPRAAAGVALDGTAIVHQAYRQRDGGAVEVWPPVAKRTTDVQAPWMPPTSPIEGDAPQLRLARIIARRIARMIESETLASRGRPVRAGDIMVLVRRRTPFIAELVRTLKSLRVPVAGIDRMVLSEQIAVMDLVALAHFALLPTDDLTLATVLKSPLIGLDEETLFRLAYGRTGSLWQALKVAATEIPACAAARDTLADVLAFADAVPPFEFFTRVLGPLDGRRKLVGRLGRDVEEAIGELLQLALGFERTHVPSLQGFLHWFETGTVEIKRDLEQGDRDAVRIMTTHGAKGLQAPIVFLPDTLQLPSTEKAPPILWPALPSGESMLLWPPKREYREEIAEAEYAAKRDREMQEYRRLLYVAMTRAEDRLIVCGWQTGSTWSDDCWYALITDGLQAAGERLGLVAEDDAALAADREFDGAAKVLRFSYPQESEPRPEPAPAHHELAPLPAWARTPPDAEAAAPRPLTPSRAGGAAAAPSPLDDAGQRFNRGRIIHRLLQTLPALPTAAQARAAAAWLERPSLALTEAERDEIAGAVCRVLDDPACAPLFQPGSLAEVPFTGTLDDRPIAGQVDRLVVGDSIVTVLDYKTDRTVPTAAARVSAAYLRQMAAYRAVLRRIYPERTVRCLLLWTAGPTVMTLDDGILDRYAP